MAEPEKTEIKEELKEEKSPSKEKIGENFRHFMAD